MDISKKLQETLGKELNGIAKGYERKHPGYAFKYEDEDLYVRVTKKIKTIEQYTKEELLEMIKYSLLVARKKAKNLDQLRGGGNCNPIADKLLRRSIECINETHLIYEDLLNQFLEKDSKFYEDWHVNCPKLVDLDKFFDGKE